ncbi:hypothetical protein QOT17_019808 [Balamuthia mandrillaris]
MLQQETTMMVVCKRPGLSKYAPPLLNNAGGQLSFGSTHVKIAPFSFNVHDLRKERPMLPPHSKPDGLFWGSSPEEDVKVKDDDDEDDDAPGTVKEKGVTVKVLDECRGVKMVTTTESTNAMNILAHAVPSTGVLLVIFLFVCLCLCLLLSL